MPLCRCCKTPGRDLLEPDWEKTTSRGPSWSDILRRLVSRTEFRHEGLMRLSVLFRATFDGLLLSFLFQKKSLRQHHRSLDHSISTKDRYIRRKQHARDGSHCDRSSNCGESHVGSNSQNGCDGKDSNPHSQGTTSVLGHRRRCSVEHVLRMRGWLCWSHFSWPWYCMWEGNQECHLEVLRQQQHHQTHSRV